MKKNKITILLITILIILILLIILLMIDIKNSSTFKKPKFDSKAVENIPLEVNYKDKVIDITNNYSIYIEPEPVIKNNNLIINFISLKTNNIWIKVRVLYKDKVVAETGLIKPNQYLEKVKLNKNLKNNDEITYVIMGYEQDTYLSAGSIKLITRIGEK